MQKAPEILFVGSWEQKQLVLNYSFIYQGDQLTSATIKADTPPTKTGVWTAVLMEV